LEKRALSLSFPSLKSFSASRFPPTASASFTHDQDEPRIAIIDTATNKNFWLIALPVPSIPPRRSPTAMAWFAYSPSGKLFSVDLIT